MTLAAPVSILMLAVSYMVLGLVVLDWMSWTLDGKSIFHGDIKTGGIVFMTALWPLLLGIIVIAYVLAGLLTLWEWFAKRVLPVQKKKLDWGDGD